MVEIKEITEHLQSINSKLDYLVEENDKTKASKLTSAGAAGGISGALVAAVVSLIKSGMSGQ